MPSPKMIHFTEGGIWYGVSSEFSHLWLDELKHMLCGANPCADSVLRSDGNDVVLAVKFGKETIHG